MSRGTLEHSKLDAANTPGGGKRYMGGYPDSLFAGVRECTGDQRTREIVHLVKRQTQLVSRTITAFELLRDATFWHSTDTDEL